MHLAKKTEYLGIRYFSHFVAINLSKKVAMHESVPTKVKFCCQLVRIPRKQLNGFRSSDWLASLLSCF